jgi:uncharacterized protein YjiS (DUF1127 family)
MSVRLVEKELFLAGSSREPTTTSPRSFRLTSILQILRTWIRRSDERRALSEIANDPRMLSDIGLTRSQALREADRIFWRP